MSGRRHHEGIAAIIPEDLLTDEEMAEMIAFAEEVERHKPHYERVGPISGGPKHTDPEIMREAMVEISAARISERHFLAQYQEAELLYLQKIEHWVRLGLPVQAVVKAAGLNNRSQIYWAIQKRLPKLISEMEDLDKSNNAV